MWIVFGILSIIVCIVGFIMLFNKKSIAYLASGISLAFVALTFLMEYRLVLKWVNKKDWSALSDVVPSMFTILCIYVIIMLFANCLLMALAKRCN